MSISLTKSKQFLFTVTIFLCSAVVMAEMGIMPFIFNVYETYYENVMACNFIASGGQLFMVAAALICTPLMRRVRKKKLLIAGTALFAVSSIFCVAVDNVLYICVMRALMGASEGVVTTIAMAYIAQLYIDEEKRAAFMGYYNAAMTVFGCVMSYLGGVLAYPDWTNGFKIFWPSVAVVICCVFFLPDLEVPCEPQQEKGVSKKEPLGLLFITFSVSYVLYTWIYAMHAYYFSAYVGELGLGSSVEAGIGTMISSIAGFITAAAFGKIYGALKKNTNLICFIGLPVAYILMYFFPSIIMGYVGSFLVGITYGLYYTYSYAYVADIVPANRIDDAIGYTTAVYGLAFFVFTYVNTAVQHIMDAGSSFIPCFLFWACFAIVPFIIEVVTIKPYNRHVKKIQNQ